ncbi:MAG TPA: 3-deoxy-7-phosphoheptulonate synthase [Opitutales bacterium]|nr:3-deoxy-7-phosphoheptulonate synthase [Opitutales bacterium]
MFRNTDDVRIEQQRPLIPPAILVEESPLSERASQLVSESRQQIGRILHGQDDRLLAVVGPCSIHDPVAALDYAAKLKGVAERVAGDVLVVMRVYFEKPRTVVGWKGLINDPFLDGSFQINKGLRLARNLLLDLASLGLPAGTEFLDAIIPQFHADTISWAAIGARTTESQIHRELASGLSMPVGFKNGTDGDHQIAIDAIRAAQQPHWFPSVTKQGVAAIFKTLGNPDSHVILRGGSRTGPNYDEKSIAQVVASLEKVKLPPFLMVDCSHANSGKDYRNQPLVARSLSEQIAAGARQICGLMIESNLAEGRQDYVPGLAAKYGQSITDACISFEQTEPVLIELAKAVRARRATLPKRQTPAPFVMARE